MTTPTRQHFRVTALEDLLDEPIECPVRRGHPRRHRCPGRYGGHRPGPGSSSRVRLAQPDRRSPGLLRLVPRRPTPPRDLDLDARRALTRRSRRARMGSSRPELHDDPGRRLRRRPDRLGTGPGQTRRVRGRTGLQPRPVRTCHGQYSRSRMTGAGRAPRCHQEKDPEDAIPWSERAHGRPPVGCHRSRGDTGRHRSAALDRCALSVACQ